MFYNFAIGKMMNSNFYKIISGYYKWIGPAIVGLLIIFTLLAYIKIFQAEFVYDDFAFIVNNKDIQSFKPFSKFFLSPDIFTGSNYSDQGGGKNWRPVASFAFAAQYALFGKNPSGFHAVSIFLHILNLILVYLLVMKITKRVSVASIVAALWALHPTATEAVSWVANQSSLIFLSFFILAILVILKYNDNRKKFFLWISYFLFILSLLTKETALGGIFIIPFVFLLAYGNLSKINLRKILLNSLPFFLLGLAYFYAHYKVLGVLGDHALRGSFWGNLLVAPTVFNKYISLLIYPVNLLLNYHSYPLPSGIGDPRVISGVLLFSILAFLFYIGLKKRWFDFIFGIIWFLAFLLPVLQIIPFQDIIGERFLYAPALGFFLMIVLGLAKTAFKKVGLGILILILPAFFILTYSRNNDWVNSEKLWNNVLKIDPTNEKAFTNLIGYYISKGDAARVIENSEKLLKINPESIGAHINLGVGLAMAGKLEEAESNFLYALSKNPDSKPALINLFVVYKNTGRYEKALEIVKNLSAKYPDDENIKKNLDQLEILVKYNKSVVTNINLIGEGKNSYIESELQGPAVEGNIVNSGVAGQIILKGGAPFEASLDVFKAGDMSKPFISVRSDAQGRFQIPLRPAVYIIKLNNFDGPLAPAQEYPLVIGSGRWLQVKIEYK